MCMTSAGREVRQGVAYIGAELDVLVGPPASLSSLSAREQRQHPEQQNAHNAQKLHRYTRQRLPAHAFCCQCAGSRSLISAGRHMIAFHRLAVGCRLSAGLRLMRR